MAMAAPLGISVAAGKAGDLLIEETRFLLDVRSQVDQLRDNLNRLFSMLSYLEERQESDRFYRSLVSEAWEVLHDGEDIIDAYTIGVPSSKRSRFGGHKILKVGMNIFTSCLFVKVHKVGSLIGGIRPRLCRVTNSVENFIAMRRSLGEGSAGFSLRNVRRRYNPSGSYAHFEEACYGRENSVEEIVSELLTTGKQHQMVTIFGMGGLGKTVVAKKVLMHAEVKRKFERFAWVSLSQGCSSRQLVEKILCDLLPEWKEEISKMEDWEMFRTLYEIQQRRRCLVVLDDFCDIKDWDSIRAGFPLENSISKLLISTRNMEISYHVNPRAYVHKLQLLSQEESFLLLKRKLCAVDGKQTNLLSSIAHSCFVLLVIRL